MLITIHQPEHLPWPGFFNKMAEADIFVILDSVPFTKNNVQNRNRIYCPNKEINWLTVPVEMINHTTKPFTEMRISPEQREWAKSYWSKLTYSYSKHPYFDLYKDELKSILDKDYDLLVDLNLDLIDFFRKHLRIEKPLIRSSEMGSMDGQKGLLLLEIAKKLGATAYLSGSGGKDYLDLEPWKTNKIDITFQQFKYPVFPAKHYHPYLSTIDIMMNCGPEARNYFIGTL